MGRDLPLSLVLMIVLLSTQLVVDVDVDPFGFLLIGCWFGVLVLRLGFIVLANRSRMVRRVGVVVGGSCCR